MEKKKGKLQNALTITLRLRSLHNRSLRTILLLPLPKTGLSIFNLRKRKLRTGLNKPLVISKEKARNQRDSISFSRGYILMAKKSVPSIVVCKEQDGLFSQLGNKVKELVSKLFEL